MLSQINSSLSRKINISDDVDTTGYDLIARIFLFFITASWLAFYPAYLLLIHMKVESFFSYDVFVNGMFGIKSFLVLVVILISISAIYMWGFVFIFRKAVISKSKSLWILGSVFVVLSIFFHYIVFFDALEAGKPLRVLWVSVLGFVFTLVISSYTINPLKNIISNWLVPTFAIIVSATLPIFSLEVTSDIVKIGLQNFKVGGGVETSIYKVTDGALIKEGNLLLLTPQYVFLRKGEAGYISISRTNNTYVSVK